MKTFYCRTCGNTLEYIQQSFDSMSFIVPVPQQCYCKNNVCKDYGYVVVAGIPEQN